MTSQMGGSLPADYVQQLSNPYAKGGFRGAQSQLRRVYDIDAMFKPAANIAAAFCLILVALVYGLTPRDQWVYLNAEEQMAGKIGFCFLGVACLIFLVPAAIQRRVVKETQDEYANISQVSGIVYAALVVQSFALATNFILGFCPNVVLFDQQTESRVFMVRWCEFAPLAGLMTFLCEAVDLPKTKDGFMNATLFSISQAVSCAAGFVFPLCKTWTSWCLWMTFSFVFYLPIFYRLSLKYKSVSALPPPGTAVSFMQEENNERIRLAYKLLLTCTIVWTGFVFLFFLNMGIHKLCPQDHFLRVGSLAMITDTFFDVCAKAVYMIIIVETHYKLENHHW